MRVLALSLMGFILAGCAADAISTAQTMAINLNGAQEAHCTLSTDHNRYAVRAPDKVLIERDSADLTIDCRDTGSSRRRAVTIEPHFGLGYWNYPKEVTVNFSDTKTNALKNGFRIPPVEPFVSEIKTENSYSAPVSHWRNDTHTPITPIDLSDMTHGNERKSYPPVLNEHTP